MENQIVFSTRCSGSIGTLTIEGLVLPYSTDFDPLVKIWTCVRRRFFEASGLDTVLCPAHDEKLRKIVCNFYLSFSEVKNKAAHTAKFETAFTEQMKLFSETITAFVTDEGPHGYATYCKVFSEGGTRRKFARMLNAFLREQSIRTSEDDRATAREIVKSLKGKHATEVNELLAPLYKARAPHSEILDALSRFASTIEVETEATRVSTRACATPNA